mmetsp:Transcript_18982/g.23509  ORF Transcript_18982/g.23509 Transcript_18982/m.23509 type:complete len:173 (-) Transcript_18982:1690-2208(-)
MAAKNKGKPIAMLMKPKYQMDERLGCSREIDKPDTLLYEELGYDRDPEAPAEKHYRKFVAKELEHVEEVMSRPSEFNVYDITRGQSRGASSGLFGGGKQDQATGEADTTTKMGVFKALITVAHKDTEFEKRAFLMRKLAKIRVLLAEIYQKQFKKPFPIQEGFFCEALGENM